MAKSQRERLCAEMELAVAMGRQGDIFENAPAVARRLASRYPESGKTAPEIHLELIRMALYPDTKMKFREAP